MAGWIHGMSIAGLHRPVSSERLTDKKLEGAGRI